MSHPRPVRRLSSWSALLWLALLAILLTLGLAMAGIDAVGAFQSESPLPTATFTPAFATDTPFPTDTPLSPTDTPFPTDTPLPPTDTPLPGETPIPTDTPPPADTPFPTDTPLPLPTDTPVVEPSPTPLPLPTETAPPESPPPPPTTVVITPAVGVTMPITVTEGAPLILVEPEPAASSDALVRLIDTFVLYSSYFALGCGFLLFFFLALGFFLLHQRARRLADYNDEDRPPPG